MIPGIEYELDADGKPTGRWRRQQYYARRNPDGSWARLPPSQLTACEWREGIPTQIRSTR